MTLPNSGEGGGDIPIFRDELVKPESGVTYDLVVEIENLEPLLARTTIPDPVDLSDIQIDSLIRQPDFLDRNFENITILGRVLIDNPNPGDHYYHIANAELYLDWFDMFNGDTVIVDENKEKILLPIENIEIGNQAFVNLYHEPGFLIDNSYLGGSYAYIPFKLKARINPGFQLLNHLKVYVRNSSEDYFLFHRSVTKQLEVRDNPFAEPVFIHTNVENGLGHFSGYSNSSISFSFSQ